MNDTHMTDAMLSSSAVNGYHPVRLARRGLSVLSIIGWDGVLPALILLAPVAARLFLPVAQIEDLVAIAVLAPIAGALLRAGIAWRQLALVCQGRPRIGRQLAMAGAIVVLILFEISSGLLLYVPNAPQSAWWFPAGLYVLYLGVINAALRPMVAEEHQGNAP